MRISDWSSDVCSSDLHLGHIGHDGYFGIDPTEVQTVDFNDTATSTTITITLKPGVESLSGSFTLDAPEANSDVDINGITVTANAQDKTDPRVTGSGGDSTDINVDTVVGATQVTQTEGDTGDGDQKIERNLGKTHGGG